MEREAALTLNNFLNNPATSDYQRLASDLEWMLTWKLKTKCTPEFFWCDGVEKIVLTQTGKHEFKITANLWLGPEANKNILNNEKFNGYMVLKPTGKGFKSYHFEINYENSVFVVKKT